MKRIARIAAGATLLASAFVAVTAQPASAAVTITVTGTNATVTATGNTTVGFSCNNGKFVAGNVQSTLNCNAVTAVHVSGDGGAQDVHGVDLDAAVFTHHPDLSVDLGAGADSSTGTLQSDQFLMGPDADSVLISAASKVDIVTMGGGSDFALVTGTGGADTIKATSTGANVNVAMTTPSGTHTTTFSSLEELDIAGGNGNDTLSSVGVTAASNLGPVSLAGDAGNDTLTAGPGGSDLDGGPGTNVFKGSTARDQYDTESETDTIHRGAGGGVEDRIVDSGNPRSGGRTIDGDSANAYDDVLGGCDVQVRSRPVAGTGIVLTSSLCRPGIAVTDPPLDTAELDLATGGTADDRGLADVVIANRVHYLVDGDVAKDDLVDITVATGTWTTTGAVPGTITVSPTAPLQGDITASSVGAVSIHNPWTNANQGFAHRVIRDLLFRFPGAAERDAIRDSLANHTKTRAQVISGLMNTDVYRGLDVDRVFVKFLKRTADPGGRTYWVNALRNGRGLRKFRAQLFGGTEYFSKAGGTNAGFLEHAYFDVLGREPDPSGRAYWLNKLNHGTERGLVANAFLASTDARRQIVKDEFLRFVFRYPTSAEENQWIPTLLETQGEPALIAFLANSGAYYANP